MKSVNAPKDFLTNCYAREGISPFLKKMEEEFQANNKPFSVLIMDVDHFKLFNDKFGHLYGDEVLKYFSSSLRLDLEDEENVPFRFGGDEFIMVFPNKTTSEAFRLAMRLRKNIRTRSCLIKGRQINVTFSGGIANCPEDAATIEDILEKADKALYYSKNHGRGRITKYSDLAKNEFLQIGVVLAILVCIGALLFFYRDTLSVRAGNLTPWVAKVQLPRLPAGSGDSESVKTIPVETPKAETPAVSYDAKVEPSISEILLQSGRVIRGLIVEEDQDKITIEVATKEGKGVVRIKKTQISQIRKAQLTDVVAK